MHVVRGALRWTDKIFTAAGVVAFIASLYLWAQAVLWWGDPQAFGTALLWSVVTLLLIGASILMERLQNRGA